MEKFLTLTKGNSQMPTLQDKGKLDYVISPTREGAAQHSRSNATTHVGFSSDMATLEATISRVLGTNRTLAPAVPEAAIKVFDEQAAAASKNDPTSAARFCEGGRARDGEVRMQDEERNIEDDARYEAKAKLRMRQLGLAGSSVEHSSAEDVERRLRRKRVIGRKITR